MNYEKQAQEFAAKHNIKMIVLDSEYREYFDDDKDCRHVFKLLLKRKGKQYTFTFGQSISNGGEEPKMYDVLACLTKSDPEDFEYFCSEYGYDTDSRKAYKTYLAVCREYNAVCRLFGDIMDELMEIQ